MTVFHGRRAARGYFESVAPEFVALRWF